MQIICAEKARDLIGDEWTRNRLYNIDYTHHDKQELALYPVWKLSINELTKSLDEGQFFLLDGDLTNSEQ